jgi:hypothetical protein
MNPRYVVHNEVELGYIDDRQPYFMDILAGGLHGRSHMNGPTYYETDLIRDATLEDFDRFRVHPPKELALQLTYGADPEWGEF